MQTTCPWWGRRFRLPTALSLTFSGSGFPLAPRRNRLSRRRSFHRRRYRHAVRLDQSQRLAHFGIDGPTDVRIVLQELPRILASLADPVALIAEPGTALLDDVLRHSLIQQVAFLGNAFAVDDVELRLAEWRRHLVLDHLHLGAIAHHHVAVLDGRDAPDVQTRGRIELQRAAARGGFRIAEHHADLFANLVDEDQAGVRFAR